MTRIRLKWFICFFIPSDLTRNISNLNWKKCVSEHFNSKIISVVFTNMSNNWTRNSFVLKDFFTRLKILFTQNQLEMIE